MRIVRGEVPCRGRPGQALGPSPSSGTEWGLSGKAVAVAQECSWKLSSDPVIIQHVPKAGVPGLYSSDELAKLEPRRRDLRDPWARTDGEQVPRGPASHRGSGIREEAGEAAASHFSGSILLRPYQLPGSGPGPIVEDAWRSSLIPDLLFTF